MQASRLADATARPWPAAATARPRIRRPCGWTRWPRATGRSRSRRRGRRRGCWCCPARWPAASSGPPEEDVAGGDAAHRARRAVRSRSAPSASSPSATPSTVSPGRRAAQASPRPWARAVQASAMGAKAAAAPRRRSQRSKASASTSSASRGVGRRASRMCSAKRGRRPSAAIGRASARLTPMPTASQRPPAGRGPDSTRMPAALRAVDQHVVGPFHADQRRPGT